MPEHVPGHFFALFLPRHVLQHPPGQNIGLFLPRHVLQHLPGQNIGLFLPRHVLGGGFDLCGVMCKFAYY